MIFLGLGVFWAGIGRIVCLFFVFWLSLYVVSGNVSVYEPYWARWGGDWATMVLVLFGSVALVASFMLLGLFLLMPWLRKQGDLAEPIRSVRLPLAAFLVVGVLCWGFAMARDRAVAEAWRRSREIQFVEENLTLRVLPDLSEYHMTGYYSLLSPNGSSYSSQLFVPFSDSVWRNTSIFFSSTSGVVRKPDGYLVTHRFGMNETLTMWVSGYRRIPVLEDGRRVVRYTVTTTRQWGRPVKTAVFSVLLPEGSEVVDSHPQEWTRRSGSGCLGLGIVLTDFLPERELEITFVPPGNSTGSGGSA